MMDLMRSALGEDRIIGTRFPHAKQVEQIEAIADPYVREAMRYNFDKQHPNFHEQLRRSKDMNPNGFWECPFTVSGIRYQFAMVDRLASIQAAKPPYVCKIVSQGLAQSDPTYIDKVVMMTRHPRSVAKSQEQLKRQWPFEGEQVVVHSPQMFINVTRWVSSWLIYNDQMPIHHIDFDELLEQPGNELRRLQGFLGEGDFETAATRIEPRYHRSHPEDKAVHEPWADAERVYALFKGGDYQGVLDYFKTAEREIDRQQKQWYCPRSGHTVGHRSCALCRKDRDVRAQYRRHAEKQGINWRHEPCMHEVMFADSQGQRLTIEQSIQHNFWVEEDPEDEAEDRMLEETDDLPVIDSPATASLPRRMWRGVKDASTGALNRLS